jgi:hypothetical protein
LTFRRSDWLAPPFFSSVSQASAMSSASGAYGWRRQPTKEWRMAIANLLGSIAFGVSAVAAYVIPSTGDVLALGAANFSTAIGALCFLIGAFILLPKASDPVVATAQ